MSYQIVKAVYYRPITYFKVPNNIDLHNQTQVEWYSVRRDILYIKLVGIDDQLKIEGYGPEDEKKYPEETEVLKEETDSDWHWIAQTFFEYESDDDETTQ
jgi:hypothetical protein